MSAPIARSGVETRSRPLARGGARASKSTTTSQRPDIARHVRSAAEFTATTGCRVRSYAATLRTTRRARPAPHDTQTSTWRPSMRKSPRTALARLAALPRRPSPRVHPPAARSVPHPSTPPSRVSAHLTSPLPPLRPAPFPQEEYQDALRALQSTISGKTRAAPKGPVSRDDLTWEQQFERLRGPRSSSGMTSASTR